MSQEPWFQASPDQIAQRLQSQVQSLEMSPLESKRRNNLLYDLELYLGRKLTSLYEVSGGDYERLWNPESLVFNVCYSIVGAIRNRICSFRPRAQFLPNGGDYLARRAARDQTALSDAWATAEHYQSEASFAMRDMLTGDGGVLKLYKDAQTVCCGRFPSWEFYFDEAESIYRQPECAYHVTFLPIELAAARYKIDRNDLAQSIVTMPPGIIYVTNRDLIRIVEAWQRGPNGKHLTVVGNKAIGKPAQWAWEYDGFPLVSGIFDEGQVGYWGQGAITPIRSIQIELNEMQMTLREAHRNAAYKYLFYQQNEEHASKLLTNAYVQGVPYNNVAPNIQVPPAIDSEVYTYVNLLKQQAYETLGVSPYLSGGMAQPQLKSEPAIREASETQSDRLAILSQVWEGMRVEAATWWDRFAKELARDGVVPKWKALHRGAYRELTFGNLEQEWMIQPFPSSVFGQSLSGRLDKAVDLIKGGFMSKEDAMKALDLPDLAPIIDNLLAQSYAMEWLVDGILEDGEYRAPDPYVDPTAMFTYAKNRYFLAISDGSNYPSDHMYKMRLFLDVANDNAKKAAAPPTPPQMPANPALAGASPELIAAAGGAVQ